MKSNSFQFASFQSKLIIDVSKLKSIHTKEYQTHSFNLILINIKIHIYSLFIH